MKKGRGAYRGAGPEDLCVVYGMPAVAQKIGAVELQLPIQDMARHICEWYNKVSRRAKRNIRFILKFLLTVQPIHIICRVYRDIYESKLEMLYASAAKEGEARARYGIERVFGYIE